MKFLVTGANGFVGTNLRRYLAEKGHECLTLDIGNADFGWDELGRIPFGEIDCVVHLAGKAHDLKKVASERSYFDVNVGLTQRIFEAMREEVKKVGGGGERRKSFIYFSSSKASKEGNAYGRSKFAAEEWLKEQCHHCPPPPHFSTYILRPAMIHGPGNKGNLNLLWGVARRGMPWPLAAFENRRSFTSIGNICAAVEALGILTTNSGAGGDSKRTTANEVEIFPIADDEMLSTNRLIELIAEVCGRKARLWRLPKRLMRCAARIGDILHLPLNTERIGKLTEDSFVDNSALKAFLGWEKMPIGAEEGMKRTLETMK